MTIEKIRLGITSFSNDVFIHAYVTAEGLELENRSNTGEPRSIIIFPWESIEQARKVVEEQMTR